MAGTTPETRTAGPTSVALTALLAAGLLVAGTRAAVDEKTAWPGVPRFAIAASPIGLHGDVRPHQYLGVVGRRAAWLGTETGEAELWVHPLKLVTAFRLDFRIPEQPDALRGADVARTVEIRPELTTIAYTHATFSVRQHVLAPLDRPGLLVLLEVDTYRPIDVVVSFQTAFQYAWPAAFGGQYATWDAANRAFLLSESQRRRNAYIGSSWATSASSPPAHALPDTPSQFTIPVDPARARREFVPIAIAASTSPRPDVLAGYRQLLSEARAVYEARRAHADRLLGQTASLHTPDPRLDLALEWAKVNLDEQMTCNPDLGCGLVAGWGPSGRSARAGFGWFFGGDAAINSFAMSSLGMTADVAQGLRFLAKFQREDGKIAHEISQSAGLIPWFTEYPYAYYHADTTPLWIVAVGRYWRAAGDRAVLDELWPHVERAFGWCRQHDSDGDGIIENTTGGLGAIEVGDIGRDIHQDVYLAAVWIEALRAMRELATARRATALADEAMKIESRAEASLNRRYWLPAAGHHAFGLLKSGQTNDALTVWPATAASFGLWRSGEAEQTLAKLAGPRIATDWGARMLANDHPLYDPTHYNMGAVWPFVTGFVALGQYRYGRPWAGLPFVRGLAQMAFDWAPGRHPELLSGAYYRPLDTAVPHQFFATSMLATALLEGLVGWRPDAPAGRARLAPALPPSWTRAAVNGLRIGGRRLDAAFERGPAELSLRLAVHDGPLELDLAPLLPAGATAVSATVDGRTASLRPASGGASRRELTVTLGTRPVVVRFAWRGGLEPEPAIVSARPGDAPSGCRLVDFAWTGSSWELEWRGSPGAACEATLHGDPVARARGAELVSGQPARLRAILPAGDPDAVLRVELEPTRR